MRVIWATLLAVVGLASPALANPPLARDSASLTRVQGEAPPSPRSLDSLDLSLSLDCSSMLGAWEASSLELSLGDVPPEGLVIEVQLSSWATAYVLADLDAALPRLDAVDGETYFASGLELHLGSTLSLYVEDFQAASGVLGDDLLVEVAPERSWDGHQISVGSRWRPTERLHIEGAAVVYALSRTRRATGVGAQASLTLTF